MTKFDFIKKFYNWEIYDDNKILEFYDAKVLTLAQTKTITSKTITALRSSLGKH